MKLSFLALIRLNGATLLSMLFIVVWNSFTSPSTVGCSKVDDQSCLASVAMQYVNGYCVDSIVCYDTQIDWI